MVLYVSLREEFAQHSLFVMLRLMDELRPLSILPLHPHHHVHSRRFSTIAGDGLAWFGSSARQYIYKLLESPQGTQTGKSERERG